MNGTPPRVVVGGEVEHFPRAVPCRDHAFDEALRCRCGMSWWAHQLLPEACPLNARGRNRGEGTRAPSGLLAVSEEYR
ncbi:MAG: hypothetical protein ABFS46_01920 [Myxococcota bacterium]